VEVRESKTKYLILNISERGATRMTSTQRGTVHLHMVKQPTTITFMGLCTCAHSCSVRCAGPHLLQCQHDVTQQACDSDVPLRGLHHELVVTRKEPYWGIILQRTKRIVLRTVATHFMVDKVPIVGQNTEQPLELIGFWEI